MFQAQASRSRPTFRALIWSSALKPQAAKLPRRISQSSAAGLASVASVTGLSACRRSSPVNARDCPASNAKAPNAQISVGRAAAPKAMRPRNFFRDIVLSLR
jgi:hypothetical protein